MSSGSNFVPLAFWVGFLALGFATSFGGPTKSHAIKEAIVLDRDRGVTPGSRIAGD